MRSLHSRIQFLLQFVQIPPEAWDWIIPHGPVLKSAAVKDYIMAGIVRDVAAQIADKDLASKVKSAGAEMVRNAAANLINGWEDGDDLCPPYPPFPWPIRHQSVFGPGPEPWLPQVLAELNPQPLPPKDLASALKVIAKYTSLPEVGKQLTESAKRVGELRG